VVEGPPDGTRRNNRGDVTIHGAVRGLRGAI
jgi:hypothetical protein